MPAHVTLFHALPHDPADIVATLAPLCAAAASCRLRITGLRSLGRGVALVVEPGPLGPLRAALARAWEPSLSAQDRQRWSPHVTIQNKVSAAEAALLLETMRGAFVPFDLRVQGLTLWRYLGGPWEWVSEHRFRPCQDPCQDRGHPSDGRR